MSPAGGVAIVILGARGARLAARLRDGLPGAEIHAPEGADCAADVRFASVRAHLQGLFRDGVPVAGVCAAGILVRTLAPLLADKRAEPPVLALAEDGSAVVPLLGGHRGANRLAREIGTILGVAPAVTTAGDAALGLALDEPPEGWVLPDPASAKAVTARLLEGEPARFEVEPGLDAGWLEDAGLKTSPRAGLAITATWRSSASGALAYRPRVLALGVGCERGAEPEALADLARRVLTEAGAAPESVACVVSIDVKAAEPAVHALASDLGAAARFFPAGRLLEETERLTARSEAAFRATGCWGVAEGAALAAVGPGGRLLAPKRIGDRCTCALALAPAVINPAATGRPQGRLAVVGLGPGDPPWRTREAQRLLDESSDLVGYDLYLDLAGRLLPGQERHAFPLGAEQERCRFALDRAAEGQSVALVCSGDPGIYALATLVFELLEHGGRADWDRVDVRVSPGVSALQAAAARTGAPLGHDFCAISLSDLLTPWPVIERRLEAAGAGDFVVALYNPASRRRREGLVLAREILLRHRPPTTPVIVARNLGRPDEATEVTTLAAFEPATVDMLSLVMVGSGVTRTVPRLHGGAWVYTPRGYPVA